MTFQPLPFVLKGLTPELETKAFLELGETPKVRSNALEELKKLIRKKSNFEPFTEDLFLMSFLRWSKFNVRKAFKALYDFYALKEKHSGVYLDVKPSDLMFVHTKDLSDFHKQVRPEILPEELGGTLGPINNAQYINVFLSKEHYIEQINSGWLKAEP